MDILDLNPDFLPLGSTPLHLAANNNDTSTLALLLESINSPSIDATDRHGRTPLVIAVQNGRMEAARMLIEHGANMDVPQEPNGQTVSQLFLSSPVFHGLIEALVEHEISLPFVPDFLLPVSAYQGKTGVIERLGAQYGVAIDTKDHLQQTALHYACQRGDVETVHILLQLGASRMATDSNGSTPLHIACAVGCVEVVRALLEDDESSQICSSGLHSQDVCGRTPAHITLYSKQFDVLLYLLRNFKAYLDLKLVDGNGHTFPGLLFAFRCQLDILPRSYMYDHLLPCLSKEEAMWFLSDAIYQKHNEATASSLALHASVNCWDFIGQTPLLFASKVSSVEICRALVDQGANPNVIDLGGKSPLQYAAEHGRFDIVEFYLSLPSIDPTPMYARYTQPLPSELVYALVDFFEKNPQAPRPRNWGKWLTLAATETSREAIVPFVEAICPKDWVAVLVSGEKCSNDEISNFPIQEECTLPLYCEGPDLSEKRKPPRKSRRRCKLPKQKLVSPYVFKRLPRRKCIPESLKSIFEGELFNFASVDKGQFFPLHQAALCGNADVFSFILSQAGTERVQAELLQMTDGLGRSVLEIAAMKSGALAEALDELQLSDFVRSKLEERFPLPAGVTFEEALLHYLIVSGTPSLSPVSKTPLSEWPLWYLEQQVSAYCQKLRTDVPSLHCEEDRENLLKLVLKHSRSSLDKSLAHYPPLLYAAVECKSVWAVQLLLAHGTSPTAKFGTKYAIIEAAKRGQVEVIDLLLQNGFAPFLRMPDIDQFHSSLLPALVTLANYGLFQMVQSLLEGFQLTHNVWSIRSAPRLLYIALASGAIDLGISLARGFVTHLCSSITTGGSAGWQSHTWLCLKRLQHYCSSFQSSRHPQIQQLVRFVSFCTDLGNGQIDMVFHNLCGMGYLDLVQLMLECADSSSAALVNKLDALNRSPLYYAACGGHLEIVQLLIDECCIFYSDKSEAPILGLLLYFSFASYTFEHLDEHYGKEIRSAYRKKTMFMAHLKSLNCLPRCSFSPGFQNVSTAKQLVTLLMPPPDSDWYSQLLSEGGCSSIHPLWTIAAMQDFTAVEHLLEKALETGESRNTSIGSVSIQGAHMVPCFDHCTMLDTAVLLAPSHTGSTAAMLFEKILIQFTSHVPLHEVKLAAQKGYWELLQTALENTFHLVEDWPSCALSNLNILQDCQYVLSLAAKLGKSAVVSAVISAAAKESNNACTTLLKGGDNYFMKPLRLAVKHNHLDVISSLVSAGDNPLPGLEVAVIHNQSEAFELLLSCVPDRFDALSNLIRKLLQYAVQYHRTTMIEYFLSLYQKPDLIISCDFPDRQQSFWFEVLLDATKGGHEDLALQAVACISDTQMKQIAEHFEYSSVLHWSCYWGMADVLGCIPYTREQLMKRGSCSPWEYAIANGHLGKLSHLPNFPSVPIDLYPWLQDSAVNIAPTEGLCEEDTEYRQEKYFIGTLLCGSFHKICSIRPSTSNTESSPLHHPSLPLIQRDYLLESSGEEALNSLAILKGAVVTQQPQIIQLLLDHMGEYAESVIGLAIDCCVPLLDLACSNGGNVEVLELLLKALLHSHVLSKYANYALLSWAVLNSSVGCVQTLLRCAPPQMVHVVDTKSRDTLLHLAVLNRNPQMVELILQHLGPSAPDSCFAENNKAEYPLFLAFACGQYESAAILLREAVKSSKWKSYYHWESRDWIPINRRSAEWEKLDWSSVAKLSNGWFRALMKQSSLESPASSSNLYTHEMTVRNILDEYPIRNLLLLAIQHNHDSIVSALLTASCGYVANPSILQMDHALLNVGIMEYVAASKRHQGVLGDFNGTHAVCRAIDMGKSRNAICLLEFMQSEPSLFTLEVNRIYLKACSRDRFELAQFLVQSSLRSAIDRDTLEEGIATAVACGAFNLAAYLQLETGLSFHKHHLPPGTKLSPLVRLIFSESEGYYSLVEKFFNSIISNPDKRLPLPALWLTHKWSHYEALLLSRRLGKSNAPSNPWSVTIMDEEDTPQTISLSIDWDSFSDCLLDSTTDTSNIPLFVEAAVFSIQVLGQLCSSEDVSTHVKLADVFHQQSSNLTPSSIILSCVLWPQEPSTSAAMGSHGLLTISYNPEKNTFVFPTSDIMDSTFASQMLDDSGIHSFLYSPTETCPYSEYIKDLVDDISESATKSSKGKYSVSIALSEELSYITDYEMFSGTYSAVKLTLTDLCNVLELVQKPSVLYSNFQFNKGNTSFAMPAPESPITSVYALITLQTSSEWRSPVEVSLLESHLDIRLNIDRARIASNEPPDIPPYETMLEKVSHCLLTAETKAVRAKMLGLISKKVVPKLQRSLKTTFIQPDSISLSFQDKSGATHAFNELLMEHLIYLNNLPHLKKFLILFSSMLQVMPYRPRLQSSVRGLFEAGFRIIISETSGTGFAVKAGMPQLVLSVADALNGTFQQSLLCIFSSIVQAASPQRRSLEDFTAGIPAPFACFVNLEQSQGLLYPTLKSTGSITIQTVDYNNCKLDHPPKSNSNLTVTIRSPSSNVYKATSSEELIITNSASKHLLVRTKENGTFEIKWMPTIAGLYRISINIDSIPIAGSPFKSFVPGNEDGTQSFQSKGSNGSRSSTAVSPLVFIVSHPKHPCSYDSPSPHIDIKDRKPIRPLLSSTLPQERESSTPSTTAAVKDSDVAKHYITVCSATGGLSSWLDLPANQVVVFVSIDTQSRIGGLEASCLPLGNGFYRVALSSNLAQSFKVFAACAVCEAAMHIHWIDQKSLFPLPCYVLPGPFSPLQSTVTTRKPSTSGSSPRKRGGKSNVIGLYTAGSSVTIFLKARDCYGNAHTSGGAIQQAVVRGAGKREFNPNLDLAGIRALASRPKEARITVEHTGNGVYQMQCEVFTLGSHFINVTDQYGKSLTIGTLEVVPGPPSVHHCRLDPNNSYKAVTTEKHTIFLHVYDRFFNPSTFAETNIQATIGSQTLHVTPALQVRGSPSTRLNCFALSFTPVSQGKQQLKVTVAGELLPSCPIEVNVIPLTESFDVKLKRLRTYLKGRHCSGYTPTITIDRDNILESAIHQLHESHFHHVVRVRFGDEPGIDTGGVASEFFHLLCQEFVNPHYALFQCVSGLYRPNPNSSVNSNHLYYFSFMGTILAKTICDGHQTTIRFTPAVYKYLLGQECVLDDLKLEDPSLHRGLLEITNAENQESLEEMAVNFTASLANFGALETIALEHGGENRTVTLANREEFVHQLFNWHLTGCIQEQLEHMKQGFCSLIPQQSLTNFSPHELEVILSGQPTIDVSFIRSRTSVEGFLRGKNSDLVMWVWEALESFSQEQRCQFLQFTTGCACLPTADMGRWEFHLKRGPNDPSLLPVAATCFNSLTIPQYPSTEVLRQKLELAIDYGQQTFLLH